ncbi:hypothetical protein BU24DRAFT_416559 [Aaosphaeria arxii CBS 175.79]|uniref:SNF2 family helicase/ATPase-like protein n=1 Tax=Aaosphaeria arxii CBS 175.79 TaxID=1450172 RepID=A0A6A5Y6I8_9PLEO|nr:uncharacterized protein BU24DRAFT_416559 [Aaosphaeria arxii CBS 175.79]KAF2020896.1 hypothetical protein BU24DRAFT_416559 [Aaosphaeria arxii CBS 175.79]
MSESPRKHRGPFRPLNTLSSPQKPSFQGPSNPRPTTTQPKTSKTPTVINLIDSEEDSSFLASEDSYASSSLAGDRTETDVLGNSSSLFDDRESIASSPLRSSPPRRYETVPTGSRRMVREREQAPPAPPAAAAPGLKALKDNTPEFGKASPLRNPLSKDPKRDPYAHLFNVPKPGKSRPEHHREQQRTAPPAFNLGNNATGTGRTSVPSRPGTSSSTASDIVEIPARQFQQRQPYQGVPVHKPTAYQAPTIQPAARPMFSSMGHDTSFQPVNPINPLHSHGSRQTVILDDDNFDPDAAIRSEGYRFGAPDLDAYVDQAKASDNIKALLEGAFDDDEEAKLPRTRGRKKKQQQKEQDDIATSLAARLQALDVKEKNPEPEVEPEEDEDEEDDGSVEGMKVKLLPHQVDGVSWMIEKETGMHNKRAKLPKGGILADDMGLGKTIQSIALILSNPRPPKDVEPENKKNKILPTVGKGTLIVAPLALIKQWEAEIGDKVLKSHSLKVLVHHGPNRTKSAEKLKGYDVVVTTYQVLASEHAAGGEGADSLQKGCFAVHWYRIILDEAHTIKNRNAKMTKACYGVRSHYRWCLTGTPMQNNLDELQSLIKFLRIQPYCEMANWKDSITGPMKNNRGNLAMRRLQIFLKAFMKRRTKEVLKKEGALNFGGKSKDGENKGGFQIVARNVETVIGSFTAKEREFYERLSNRAESRLAEMMGGEKQDYIGALVLLLRLRQACNHPNLTRSNVKDDKDALTTGSKPQSGPQTPRKSRETDDDDLAALMGGLSVQTKRCDVCQTTLNKNNATSGGIRCDECENDLNESSKKSKKHKKRNKHKHRKHKKQNSEANGASDSDDEEPVKTKPAKSSRQRPVIQDSDDEEEGEWLVPEDQRDANLGKAGGTDDEDADGGGDTLGSVDSDSFASADDGTPSKKKDDSFIVHDTDSEDEAPPAQRRLFSKKKKVYNIASDDDSESESDSETEGSDSESESEDTETGQSDIEYNASDITPSTKIRQLLSILEKDTPEHKVIVFSQFTSMLDLIEPFLRRNGYNFTRYDGSMRNDLREASLHKLRNDKRTRVLLCSLKCGSLGLNLTAASRVVIMEPFWNPFVEEQAIDRVHRLNQTVDVTVYRLSIHNSVEERILELQEAKRKLAEAAIEGGKAIGKLSMKDILALFKRDAEYDHQNVDDGSEANIFARTRVLDNMVNSSGYGEDSQTYESTAPRRKAGSLGLKPKRQEDSVWGRR